MRDVGSGHPEKSEIFEPGDKQGDNFFPMTATLTERQWVDACVRLKESANAMYRLSLRRLGLIEVTAPNVPKWFEACFDGVWKAGCRKLPDTAEALAGKPSLFVVGYVSRHPN